MFVKFKPLTWLQLKYIQLLPAVFEALPKAGLKFVVTLPLPGWYQWLQDSCRHSTHIKVLLEVLEFVFLRALT